MSSICSQSASAPSETKISATPNSNRQATDSLIELTLTETYQPRYILISFVSLLGETILADYATSDRSLTVDSSSILTRCEVHPSKAEISPSQPSNLFKYLSSINDNCFLRPCRRLSEGSP